MAIENEAKPEDVGDFKETFTLKVLLVVKEAQLQHGLRHGDYQRYRSYCSRRLERLKKSLHFVCGAKRRYQAKKITQEILKDVRYLYIPLIMAERAWSYAMQLKQEANTEHRKRYHLRARLRKAISHAKDLKELCEGSKCDARTKLEAQAYFSWLEGLLKVELEDWHGAHESFTKAQTIYMKLAEALTEDEGALYKQKVDEFTPNIRYCEYNIGDKTAIDDLVQMRMSGKTDEDLFSTNLNVLISQTREKQAATLSEVTWMGRTVQVRQEKVRIFLLNVKEFENELAKHSDIENKISAYERLLLECKDVLQQLHDELKGENQPHRGPDTVLSSTAFLYSYLQYLKLFKTSERYLMIIETLKQPVSKKPVKLQDFIRPYEILVQNLNEILQLAGIDMNSTFVEEIQAKIVVYKAFKCFYIAQTLTQVSKWLETMAIYQRASSYISQALRSQYLEENLKNEVKELEKQIELNKYSCYAQSILTVDQVTDQLAKVKIQPETSMLVDRLDKYYEDPSLLTRQPKVTSFPPEFKPIPCKPLFYDLAPYHLEFPSLEDRMEQKQGGITGLVKGWLGGWKGK